MRLFFVLASTFLVACSGGDGSGTDGVGGSAGASNVGGGGDGGAGGDGAAGAGGGGLPGPCDQHASGLLDTSRALSAWSDRDYIIHVPPSYDCSTPMPVVVWFHGGGGVADGAHRNSCFGANGGMVDETSDTCLNVHADNEGFIVVYPNGTVQPESMGRGFNAGGGVDPASEWACVSHEACQDLMVDDVQYTRDVLDDLSIMLNVDDRRVYSTGISNGGAMSHRLACELSDRIAAVASIAGQGQFQAADPSACTPPRAMPVLIMHGTDDPLWPYATAQLNAGIDDRLVVGAEETAAFWTSHNQCGAATTTSLPDIDTGDGPGLTSSTVERTNYADCNQGGDVVLYKIDGGGHTVPGGHQYLHKAIIGPTNRDIVASHLVWEFFQLHTLP